MKIFNSSAAPCRRQHLVAAAPCAAQRYRAAGLHCAGHMRAAPWRRHVLAGTVDTPFLSRLLKPLGRVLLAAAQYT